MRRALLAGALLLSCAAGAAAQISPGPLSRFHQSLEGARNCRSCHGPKGVTRELCLTCHAALFGRIAEGEGLHARAEYAVGCERCHVEHQGRGFELVFWGKEGRASFDHAQTGFPLRGRHAALGCESCHALPRIRDRAGLARGGVNLARTFLGLGTECSSCHADPHEGQFAARACTDCHDQERWKPPARFDHHKTAFPLAGAHAPLSCSSCHRPGPGGAVRFKGTPHQTCASCHADPHGGRMGAACATCHSAAGWSRIDPGRFDHGKTRFPLTGRHEKVGCGGCHGRGPGGMKFQGTPQACAGCHEDPHAGRLGSACAACHTTAGFDRIQPGQFDHDRTGFPLQGRHAEVKCDSCHRPGRPRPLRYARCADCHQDRHAGQLAGRADGGRCESCHDVTGFEPARFSPEDHARTRMPLAGAHLAVACDACHREVPLERLRAVGVRPPPGSPPRTEQMRFASTACSECHDDPHRGRTARFGRCEACHEAASWRTIRFDHDRQTSFPLQGAHRSVPCARCHLRDAGGRATMEFAGLGRTCSACHGAQRR